MAHDFNVTAENRHYQIGRPRNAVSNATHGRSIVMHRKNPPDNESRRQHDEHINSRNLYKLAEHLEPLLCRETPWPDSFEVTPHRGE